MNDDLNTPLALSKLHLLISEANKIYDKEMSKSEAAAALDALLEIDMILGLNFEGHMGKKELPDDIKSLVEERERYRKAKNFKEADKIRVKLRVDHKIEIEDTENGPVWHRL